MDVNILVYAHREDVDNHDKFRYWLESIIKAMFQLIVAGRYPIYLKH
ncbi:MAG: hypothetical protein QNK20_11660 [Aureibaculum sp.]|nr:hypothetical protein [Aureibaculum sp.]